MDACIQITMSKTAYVLLPIYRRNNTHNCPPTAPPTHTHTHIPRKEGWNILQQIANSGVVGIHGSIFF